MTIFEDYNLKQFDNLELLAKQVVEGFIIGLHKSPFHGFSVEFAEHRLYNEGESTKDIDWKVYARTDKMFIKKFEEETNLRCQMVIDISSSMYFPADKSFNKLKFSALSSAALMNLLRRQRDAFGLSVFADKLYENTRCKSSNTHYQYLLSILDGVLKDNKNNRPTAAAENLHILADSLHKRSLVIIFSDMFENMAESKELFDALQHLRYAKHEVILFHTVDKSLEIDFNYENSVPLYRYGKWRGNTPTK